MMEGTSHNALTFMLPVVNRKHRLPLRTLQGSLRFVRKKLGTATIWMAVFSPLYAFHSAMLQGTYPPLGLAPCLVLIGMGASFVYTASNLTTLPEDHLPLTTTLLIGFGLVASLAAFWAPYK
jgi:hypothetical protein